MLARIRRLLNRFFRRSRTINNKPLNQASLIVIILVDIFILINVFIGLDDISRWYLGPSEVYPCYSDWRNYRTQKIKDKDYEIVRLSLPSELDNQVGFEQNYKPNQVGFEQNYKQAEVGHLGHVSEACLNYATYQDKIRNSANQQTIKTIEQKQTKISDLEQTNRTIRAQYDSTLLEKIAGQASERSINAVRAEKAKQELDQNNRAIATLSKELSTLKSDLVAKPESANFITFLKDDRTFGDVEKGYQQASFWYPSIQFVFQALFLLPMLLIALAVHKFAQRKGYGLISLISWHLLVIFFIPLIFKVFEFLQIGALFQFLSDVVIALFNGLRFLISYVYILLIPLVGFGIIKFFQRFAANPKIQAATRVQNSNCIQCARRIRHQDTYCPHCGYYQYTECPNCHDLTYKHLPYCKQCGHSQEAP